MGVQFGGEFKGQNRWLSVFGGPNLLSETEVWANKELVSGDEAPFSPKHQSEFDAPPKLQSDFGFNSCKAGTDSNQIKK